jgi:phage gp36-like protein
VDPFITDDELQAMGSMGDLFAEVPLERRDAARAAATAEAVSYLRAFAAPPYTSVGDDVKQAVADIASYRCASDHGYRPDGTAADIRQRFDDAMDWLKMVASGAVTPDLVPAVVPITRFRARVLSREPRGW